MHVVDQATLRAANDAGWTVRVVGEARLALALRKVGFCPDNWEFQFQLGPYRLDFAHPLYQIDVEADGWVHTAGTTRSRDNKRDRQLLNWGWHVFRVDSDDDGQIAIAARSLHRYVTVDLPRYEGRLWSRGERHVFRRRTVEA